MNTLVGKLQDKTKEQRGQVNALKENEQTLTAQGDEKDRTIAQLVKELQLKKLQIDSQNVFITQLKQQNESQKVEISNVRQALGEL